MTDEETTKPMSAFFMTEAVPKFSGEDLTYSSTKWTQDIEDNAEIFSWTAQQKLIIARKSLTGTAELWLKTEKAFKSYDDLKAALVKEFPDSINSKEMHETMSTRRKKPSETCYQYMLIMKELGKRAKFPDYVSIQYIIDGIPDSQVNKMCLYGVTTYTALKDKLAIYEAMKLRMKPRQESRSEGLRTENTKNNQQRCFKCGEPGHLASGCSSGIKCFRCNSYGHIGVDCKASISGSKDGGLATASTPRNVGNTGGNARVRRSMFAETQFTEGAVRENECKCRAEQNAQWNETSQT
ncbi:uncharacterized protein LOC133527284 [Cydia pomonella]|uniref:uncharacterized protein LOC133527284 n=1 Tax=Cydia pomonella TaxID=82600 RepID=UPI002ADDF8D3|nr:uncharacterized protein LOC133527284 [Cydia pomonella]